MSIPLNTERVSVNFQFLEEHDNTLVLYAGRAERYVLDDPNTSLIKLRQFAEFLAKHAAAYHGFETVNEDFREVLNLLRQKSIIERRIRELFDMIRLQGNEAIHEGVGDRKAALAALVTAYELAVWFHRTFKDQRFAPGPFRPPPSPPSAEKALLQDLAELREEATIYRHRLHSAEGEIEELERTRSELERETQELFSRLSEKKEMLAVSEAKQEVERAEYERQLSVLRNEMQKRTPDELASFVERSQSAAQWLGMREEDSHFVPIAQIRLQGPELSWCHKAPTLLVQSMSGGFVTANCSVCNSSSNLRADDFNRLDIWVDCPKCRTRLQKTTIFGNYGFECPDCKWRCILASLVPHYTQRSVDA